MAARDRALGPIGMTPTGGLSSLGRKSFSAFLAAVLAICCWSTPANVAYASLEAPGPQAHGHTEVHTYFVAGDVSAPAVWVHNACAVQVDYGSTELSRAAIAFRGRAGLTRSGANVLVAEYAEGAAMRRVIIRSRDAGRAAGHSERRLLRYLDRKGIDPSRVTSIYSELEPCGNPGAYCRNLFGPGGPFAHVSPTYSVPYPAGTSAAAQVGRQEGVQWLQEQLQDIFPRVRNQTPGDDLLPR